MPEKKSKWAEKHFLGLLLFVTLLSVLPTYCIFILIILVRAKIGLSFFYLLTMTPLLFLVLFNSFITRPRLQKKFTRRLEKAKEPEELLRCGVQIERVLNKLTILFVTSLFTLFIGSFYLMSLGLTELGLLLFLIWWFYIIFYFMSFPIFLGRWIPTYSLFIRSSLKIVIDHLKLLARSKKDDSEMRLSEKNPTIWFKTTLKSYDEWLKIDHSATIKKLDPYFNTVYIASLFGSSSELIKKIIPVLEELFNKADNLFDSIKTLGKFRLEKQSFYSIDELSKILVPATLMTQIKDKIKSNYEILAIFLLLVAILVTPLISLFFGR